jgi:glutamate:GABA antiporter
MAASGEFVEHTTAMAVEEKAKLQKHFSRFDMLFFLICTLVGVDTLGQVSSYGAQGFTWLIFLGIFFFIPYALLTAEIGSAFTEEGGPYVWTKLAWGRFLACLNGVLECSTGSRTRSGWAGC